MTTVSPRTLVAKVPPGESAELPIRLSDLPSGGSCSVAVAGSGFGVTIEELVAYRQQRRPATEAEIEELPPFPPSIRERARREGIVEQVESARVAGNGPISVDRGGELEATLLIEPARKPIRTGLNADAANVSFSTPGTDRIDVPVVALVARGELAVTPVPEQIVCAAKPGEVISREVSIWKAPAASIVAWIDTASPSISLQALVVQRQVQMWFTEDELADMPPALREKARRKGYVVFEDVGRVGAGEPLGVPQDAVVSAYVDFAPPATGAAEMASGTLVIESSTWRRIEVPLFAILGNIAVELVPDAVTIRQGERGTITAEIRSVGGPGTNLTISIGFPGDPWSIEPTSVAVPRDASLSVPLTIAASNAAWTGEHRVNVQLLSFDGIDSLALPITISVLGGDANAQLLQNTVVIRQGDRANCAVRLSVGGGYKRFTFSPGLLPDGIALNAPPWEGEGGTSNAVQLEFVADPLARAVPSRTGMVRWSANDGEHAGEFKIIFTVLLQPESRTFSQPVVTPPGTALGGAAGFVVNNDGSGSFRGFMRATGALSYHFGVRAALRSANGRIAMLAQKTGAVYGTFEPGDRQFDWDEPVNSGFVGDAWPEVRTASLVVSKSYELGGVLGGAIGLLSDVAEFLAAAPLLSAIVPGGSALAAIVLVGSELGGLSGVHVVGPGGLVGLTAAGTSLFLVGPQALLPVFLTGAAIGTLAVKQRRLNDDEITFVRQVFHDTLPFDRIILTNLSADGGREFTAPNVDGGILVNLGGDGFDHPLTYTAPNRGYTANGQVLIHELTHAWQLAHGGLLVDFFWRALVDRLGGSASYKYGPPGTPWDALSLEAQASVVDNWFAGSNAMALDASVTRKPMGEDDPYFQYISDVIRMGMTS